MKFLRLASGSVVVSVAVLVLSACGSTHPGQAAVVGDGSITMKAVDDYAAAACLISGSNQTAGGGEVAPIDNAQVRREAVGFLVKERIAADLVEQRHLAVDESLSELPDDLLAQINDLFGDDAAVVTDVFAQSREHYARLVTLGSDETGQLANEAIIDALATQGDEIVTAAFADYDLDFDPRFGINDAGEITGDIGSISVASLESAERAAGPVSPAIGCVP